MHGLNVQHMCWASWMQSSETSHSTPPSFQASMNKASTIYYPYWTLVLLPFGQMFHLHWPQLFPAWNREDANHSWPCTLLLQAAKPGPLLSLADMRWFMLKTPFHITCYNLRHLQFELSHLTKDECIVPGHSGKTKALWPVFVTQCLAVKPHFWALLLKYHIT